ncbi:DNA polymerase III subunit delta' [Mycobacterium tuberculosis]|uniref:DNA polymerase III subunit delta n=1 Tax=Mycobacterium tuberculosis TaxID=1773 RepID=A0A655J4T9_MYCTX|nr:DNA polymerase III subunit delta' [Mycobacterium tuberculosis]
MAGAEAEALALTAQRIEAETEELRTALGAGGTGKGTGAALRGATGAMKDLERRQKSRQTRASRDALDRALIDLATYFRDALLVAAHAGGVRANHPDMADRVAALAAHAPPERRSASGQRQTEVRRRCHGRHHRPGTAVATAANLGGPARLP